MPLNPLPLPQPPAPTMSKTKLTESMVRELHLLLNPELKRKRWKCGTHMTLKALKQRGMVSNDGNITDLGRKAYESIAHPQPALNHERMNG